LTGTFEGPSVFESVSPTSTCTPTLKGTEYFTSTPYLTPPNITQSPTLTPTPLSASNTGCLEITNPSIFYYNLILLTWTSIFGADHYRLEAEIDSEIYTFDNLLDNSLKIKVDSLSEWQNFINIGRMQY